jgi:hypothetical protein
MKKILIMALAALYVLADPAPRSLTTDQQAALATLMKTASLPAGLAVSIHTLNATESAALSSNIQAALCAPASGSAGWTCTGVTDSLPGPTSGVLVEIRTSAPQAQKDALAAVTQFLRDNGVIANFRSAPDFINHAVDGEGHAIQSDPSEMRRITIGTNP